MEILKLDQEHLGHGLYASHNGNILVLENDLDDHQTVLTIPKDALVQLLEYAKKFGLI